MIHSGEVIEPDEYIIKGNPPNISSYIMIVFYLRLAKDGLMRKSNNREIIPGSKPGFMDGLTNYFKLIARLMTDRRVNPFLKLLPISTLAYLAVPDLVPFVIDDALVIWLGTYLFIELCPPEVVDEHRAALEGNAQEVSSDKRFTDQNDIDDEQGEVIDAEYWDEKNEKD